MCLLRTQVMPKHKKQHWVPQSYLRKFSSNGKRLWVYDRPSETIGEWGHACGLSSGAGCVAGTRAPTTGPGSAPHRRIGERKLATSDRRGDAINADLADSSAYDRLDQKIVMLG
jgi:hypothetical protein